jgi:hypothetical protein
MNIPGNDITGITALSLQQCVDACSTWNTRNTATPCKAVVLNADVAGSYNSNFRANCWLKTKDERKPAGANQIGGTVAYLTAP